MNQEKRLWLRRPLKTKVILEDEWGRGILYLYSKDISLGGVFLREPPPLKLGAHLFLSFALPGKKRPLRLTGEVVRFFEGDLKKERGLTSPGAGIRFIDVDPATRMQLESYIQKRS